MLDAVLTGVNLFVAVVCAGAGIGKAVNARSRPGLPLKITASVLLFASAVYLLSAPAVYRAVGEAVSWPNVASLPVSVFILLCMGHAHLLTMLWHPRRRTADALRRSIATWAPMYAVAVAAMVILFVAAGPIGPARPLTFAVAFAHLPWVLAFELVFLTALVVGIIATVRQCRGPDGVIALPERPDLAHSLKLFAAAVALDLAYVAGTAIAVIAASREDHRFDVLAAAAWVFAGGSALVASYGLAKPALAARAADRRDHQALIPLWEAVALPGQADPLPPSWLNSQFALTHIVIRILDNIRLLRPWTHHAIHDLVKAEYRMITETTADDLEHLRALETAAALQYERRLRSAPDAPRGGEAALRRASAEAAHGLPTDERGYLLRVAACVDDPVVTAVVDRLAPPPSAPTPTESL
ncbi:predicted protein [Streptomyces viridochromogenes DSM 40736]|uniref:Predicted protein n=1 Tax=Streptomyces viridochromogenes (strain DSM 40736 / JCM 4977 / BCRC 1201 / Tue 494) TaxID=591159 RepID=D9X1T6_STRVT|nr:DUF6545 domain-containing protein [Streptomyces viridochromogenes]EFL29508.1 predicted protein [Streptomyces viridochromogenes DSM 40736]